MKKIPSLFVRDGAVLTSDYNPLARWVVEGEGIATRKFDGMAVRWFNDQLWARYDAKKGKIPPAGFEPCQEPDLMTGHHPGWVPANRLEDKWIRKAAEDHLSLLDLNMTFLEWTYEACGPRIGGNPEGMEEYHLIRHGSYLLYDAPRDHTGLLRYFTENDIEGIVWWRDINDVNCDKVKITGAALGIPRSVHIAKRPV